MSENNNRAGHRLESSDVRLAHRDSEKGAVVAIVAVLLPVLLGCVGLAVDNGLLYAEKRQMQTAADATALAAAHEWRQQNFSGYADVAREDAARNGFLENAAVDVEITVPPVTGPRAGDGNFVEIVIRQERPLFFMRAFSNEPAIIEARAVAGLVPADACVYILDPSASQALVAAGDARVTLEGCGVHVNSDSNNAARTVGGGSIDASSIGIVGDYSGSGFFPTPQTGIYAAPDPLADLAAPSTAGCNVTGQLEIMDTQVLNPGVYCGGIRITAQGHATMNPGIYVMKGGGLDVHAGGELDGTGVMIYNTEAAGYPYDPVLFSSNSSTELKAPTSGDYKGILIFQDRDVSSNQENKISGTPDTKFEGTLYFPTTDVKYVGTSSTYSTETLLLARRAEFRGTSDFKAISPSSDLLPTALAVARVVE